MSAEPSPGTRVVFDVSKKIAGTTMRKLMMLAVLSGAVVTQPLYGQAIDPPVPQMTPLEPQSDQIPLPEQGAADQSFTDVAIV
ncbi:hypothetical protein C7I87_26500, partial [Mesorhizobium sp. SARCC-RB16n]